MRGCGPFVITISATRRYERAVLGGPAACPGIGARPGHEGKPAARGLARAHRRAAREDLRIRGEPHRGARGAARVRTRHLRGQPRAARARRQACGSPDPARRAHPSGPGARGRNRLAPGKPREAAHLALSRRRAKRPETSFLGEDPGGIARELYYYSHVSRAQAEFIRELGSSLEQLHKLEAGAREKSAELAAIESAARKERSALLKEQAERRGVLERVSVQLREQRREVKQLERDESRLSRLVEELGRGIAATPLLRNDKGPEPGGAEGPLAGPKPGLRLPIKGELTNRFGAQRQSGGPPWKSPFIRS